LEVIGYFEPTFVEAHQAPKMICKVLLFKSHIKKRSFLAQIITTSHEIFKDFESDMTLGLRMLDNPTSDTVESNSTLKQNAGY
jgi:hypothetical protein